MQFQKCSRQVIDRNGKFKESKLSNSHIKRNNQKVPQYILVRNKDTPLDIDITISQKDIREVQKAKGAMQAGARILINKMGIETLDSILLAGAFGNYIDKSSALTIGLFPYCDLHIQSEILSYIE